jgi:hypothetical protein
MICYIKVSENTTGTCYILDYSWRAISGNATPADNLASPFISLSDAEGDFGGAIVAKNLMTSQMISHLVMPSEDLQQVCGLGTESDYRGKIIRSLATLWD